MDIWQYNSCNKFNSPSGRRGWLGVFSHVVFLLVCLHITLNVSQAYASSERVALLVTNSDYYKTPLNLGSTGASELSVNLTQLGFDVSTVADRPYYDLDSAIDGFANKARSADIALFYYSGHSIKLGANNYLVPVDVDLRSRADIRKLVELDVLLDAVSTADNGAVILDTCWESSLAAGWGESFGRSAVCADELRHLNQYDNVVISLSRSKPRSSQVGTETEKGDYARQLSSNLNPEATLLSFLESANEAVRKNVAFAENPVIKKNSGDSPELEKIPARDDEIVQPPPTDVPIVSKLDTFTAAPETVSVRSRNVVATELSAGIYQVRSVRTSNYLFNRANVGKPVLKALDKLNIGFNWQIEILNDGSVVLVSMLDGRYLATDVLASNLMLSSIPERRALWKIEDVPFGTVGEHTVQNTQAPSFLLSRRTEVSVSASAAEHPGGWIFEYIDEYDPGTRERLFVQAKLLNADEGSNALQPLNAWDSITLQQLEDAKQRFSTLSDNIKSGELDSLYGLVAPGHYRDTLRHLVLAYDSIDIEQGQIEVDDENKAVISKLTIKSMMLDGELLEPIDSMQYLQLLVLQLPEQQWSNIKINRCETPDQCESIDTLVQDSKG